MSRQKRNPDAQWFVEPLDPVSNQRIVEFLSVTSGYSYEMEYVKIADDEGQLHNVLEVSFKAMNYIVKSKTAMPDLKFRIWNRTRPRSPLRDCSRLFERKKDRGNTETKRVQQEIQKIKTRHHEPF